MSGALSAEAATDNRVARFLDFCRLEKGLSSNSLDAYSADLSRLIAFIWDSPEPPDAEQLGRYLDHLSQTGLGARSVARHLSTLRNFYGFSLREGLIDRDTTEHLRTPKQWQTIPKFLNLEEIEKVIQAPDPLKPTGLRDRAMLELLYATGLRVSELCGLRISDLRIEDGVVRTIGKGDKQRLVPVGTGALRAVSGYLKSARGKLL